MYDAAILACAVIGTIAAILMVLPLFGVDLRLRRRSDMSAEMSASPKGRREKRLWAAVALAIVSVVLSGASFYRLERPRTVQKIIEKPVDRMVEKLIPAECPKPQPSAAIPKPVHGKQPTATQPALVIPPGKQIEATTTAPDSAAVGVNTGTVTVNPPVNPYRPVITYDFDGFRRESSPGELRGDDSAVNEFEQLRKLQDQKDWKALAQMSEKEIKQRPEWLTPYLFTGIAYANLGNKDAAIKKLQFVSDKSAGLSEYSDADRILKILKQQP